MNYTQLQQEIQLWLGDVRFDLAQAIPAMIRSAEARFNRMLRTHQMQCESTHPLVWNGITEATNGTYTLPTDWLGQKSVRRKDDLLYIVYWRKIPALTDQNPTNWLLDSYPDLYRSASLLGAEAWLQRDPKIAMWQSTMDRILLEIAESTEKDEFSAATLRVRTTSDRPWELLHRESGIFERIELDQFLALTLSEMTNTQLQQYGYYTIRGNTLLLWPKPGIAGPTGDPNWSACP